MELLDAIFQFVGTHPFITFTIVAALAFDFVNGFHDSANAIATVVATRVLTPLQAVMVAGFFNFVGPFLFSLAVATTIGKGILDTDAISPDILPHVVFAALVGAIVWDLVTWWTGLPTSSSHALVGGLLGAGLAAAGLDGVVLPHLAEWGEIGKVALMGSGVGLAVGFVMLAVSRARLPHAALRPMAYGGFFAALIWNWVHTGGPSASGAGHALEWGLSWVTSSFTYATAITFLWVVTQRSLPLRMVPWFAPVGAAGALVQATLAKTLTLTAVSKTVLFMVVSPFLGFLSGFLLATIVAWWAQGSDRAAVTTWSKRLQLLSSSFYALTHGTNDAQKTMGVIGVLLVASGALAADPGASSLDIPTWVIISSAGAMGLGTLFGGWRIVKTMAARITHLRPAQGFAAETAGGVVLVAMAHAGIPVSTTHAISSSIMGVGATRRTSAVRWAVGRRIVGAWVLTIPASALVAFVCWYAIALVS